MKSDFEREEDYISFLEARTLEQLLENKDEEDVNLLVEIGKRYGRLKRYPDAVHYYEIALALDPHEVWTNIYLGNLYFLWRKYPKAEHYFKRSIEIRPSLACAYWCLGDVYCHTLQDSLATEMYEKAALVEPDDRQAARKLKEWRSRYRDSNRG